MNTLEEAPCAALAVRAKNTFPRPIAVIPQQAGRFLLLSHFLGRTWDLAGNCLLIGA